MSVAALRVRGLRRAYGSRAVLHDVDFELAEGERLAIVGASGAGKSTLIRILAGLMPADSGQVELFGRPHSRWRSSLGEQVGLMEQGDSLVPGLRVFHNVAMGRLARVSTFSALLSLIWPRARGEVRAVLAEVELACRMWAHTHQLSGGEARRVALARLFLQAPRVLLADEPTSGLDVRLADKMMRRLTAGAEQRGCSLVVNLHALELLDCGFDRVLGLREGRIVWQGLPAQWGQVARNQVFATGLGS